MGAMYLDKIVDWFFPEEFSAWALIGGGAFFGLLILGIWLYAIMHHRIEKKWSGPLEEAKTDLETLTQEHKELRNRGSFENEVARKANHLLRVMVETVTFALYDCQVGGASKLLTSDQAKQEEREAQHEVWVCTSDLVPDTGLFMEDTILANISHKKSYRYIFDNSQREEFEHLKDNVANEDITLERLTWKVSPVKLSKLQIVILDAEHTEVENTKVFLHMPWFTAKPPYKDTIYVGNKSMSKELVRLFKTLWKSLPKVSSGDIETTGG